LPAKSKSQQRFMGMVRNCQKTGECASDTVKKAAGSMKDKDTEKFAKTKHKGLPEKVTESKLTFKQFLMEGYTNFPPMDRERYQERQGLEGPFMARNGKVYYYDPKEGKYYDPDSDFYISDEDFALMDQSHRQN